MMKTTFIQAVAFCLLGGVYVAAGADLIQPQKGRMSTAGLFVPIRLDEDAHDQLDVGLPAEDIIIRSVPYDLVHQAGVNHLFLKSAEWPDWKEDPSSYYAAYDK